MENQERIIIKSYSKAWKIENRIYSVGNIKLPRPISPRQLLYFAVVALVIFILSQILPFLKLIPTPIRYAILPIFITWFVNKKKLDGKNPFKFFGKLIIHLFTKGLFIERFTQRNPRENAEIKLNWWCSCVKMSD